MQRCVLANEAHKLTRSLRSDAIVKFVSPAKKTRGQAGSKKTAQVTDASLSGNESASKGLKTGVGLFAEEDLSSRTLYATAVSR